jgi:hypothetical protein
MKKLTDQLISERFDAIKYRDQYGQRDIFDQRVRALLPEFTEEEVKIFCKNSPQWQCSLYGGRVGQYYAITKKYY